jgi:hypothetical protein
MRHDVFVFVGGLWAHWASIVFGSVLSLIVIVVEKWALKEVKWKHVSWVMLAAIVVSCFLTWRDEYTSAEWRGGEIIRINAQLDDKNKEVEQLKSRPPIVVQSKTDPELIRAMGLIEKHLSQVEDQPVLSLKKRALRLSSDILKFYDERKKGEPKMPFQFKDRQEQENWFNSTVYYSTQTQDNYLSIYGGRVREVLDDLKEKGLTDPTLDAMTQFKVGAALPDEVAVRIAALAQKLP